MDEIGKLLFNALVSRRAIWLPEVGTFRTGYIGAVENADGSITPPRNEPAFSEGQADDAAAITDLMQHIPGGETPRERYDRWLLKATERGPVVIEGIGVVNNCVFTPYESLMNTLNPIPAAEGVKTKPAAKKGLSKTEKRWLAFIALCILVLAGGWTWWHFYSGSPSGHNRWNAGNAAVTDNMDRLPEQDGIVERTREFKVTEVVDTVEEPAPTPVENTTAVQSGKAIAGFYVVGNVFAVPENADKYISEMQQKYPDLEYVKHPFNGKTLVSLYSSTVRAQANRERRKIEDRILKFDLWLYEVN